jgi:AGCS family alanine or glycine:cation symporter
LFAVFTALAAFGIGDGVQSNAVSVLVTQNFNIPGWVTGLVLSALTAVVLLGGIKRLSQVCEKLVPLMAVIYIIGCIIILVMNAEFFFPAIKVICDAAFSAKALGGGFVASTLMTAMRYGVARGLFSNESGMGSAPIVCAAAQTRNAVRTGLVSSTGAFWDTVVICLVTGLVVVTSALHIEAAGLADSELLSGNGSLVVHAAFSQIPVIGNFMLTFGLLTFAFSTILGWSYYGEKGAEYLFGPKSNIPYRCIYILVTFLGTVASLDIVWNIADALNALMTVPNLIAVLLLSGVVVKETKHYLTGNNIDEVDTTPIPLRTDLKTNK